jgi:hypothetical protein
VAAILTPDTILRRHRELIAAKWAYPAKRRLGRPGIMKAIRELIVRVATDNPSWGYGRIQSELKKLDHKVARSTIAKTLKAHGIRASSASPTSWRTFLRARADATGTGKETTRVRRREPRHRSIHARRSSADLSGSGAFDVAIGSSCGARMNSARYFGHHALDHRATGQPGRRRRVASGCADTASRW